MAEFYHESDWIAVYQTRLDLFRHWSRVAKIFKRHSLCRASMPHKLCWHAGSDEGSSVSHRRALVLLVWKECDWAMVFQAWLLASNKQGAWQQRAAAKLFVEEDYSDFERGSLVACSLQPYIAKHRPLSSQVSATDKLSSYWYSILRFSRYW